MPSPQAVPSTFTTLSPARRTSGSFAIAALGAPTRAWGPFTAGTGSRQDVVQGPENARLLERIAQIALPWTGDVQRGGAERPGEQQPERAEQCGAADPVEPRQHPPGGQVAKPKALGDALHDHREQSPDDQSRNDGDQRGVLRLAAAGEQCRPQAPAGHGSGDEPGEGQGARDQPALVAHDGEREREDGDDHVDDVHLTTTFLPA